MAHLSFDTLLKATEQDIQSASSTTAGSTTIPSTILFSPSSPSACASPEPASSITSSPLLSTTSPLLTSSSPLSSNNSPTTTPNKPIKKCHYCHSTNTPMWRRDPHHNVICNACKLYLKSKNTYRTPELVARLNKIKHQNALRGSSVKGPCVKCGVEVSPYWRRDEEGRFNCNACGLKVRYTKKPKRRSVDVDVKSDGDVMKSEGRTLPDIRTFLASLQYSV